MYIYILCYMLYMKYVKFIYIYIYIYYIVFSVVQVTQDVIIYVVNKWKKQTSSKVIKQEKHKIFHQLTCKSQGIIYLLQCRICFIQYVGKSEAIFNLRFKNHRKDSKKKDAILACTHFQKSDHIFQQDAKFVLIEQIRK